MKLVAKFLVYSSIAFIVICILISIIISKSNFDFRDGGDTFEFVLFYGIPLALLTTLFSLYYTRNDSLTNSLQVVFTILASFAFFVVYGLILATDWCCYSEPDIQFIKKNDESKVIAERDFGCGAVDSTPPSESHWIIEEYPFGLIYTIRADTSTLDLTQWIRVEIDQK